MTETHFTPQPALAADSPPPPTAIAPINPESVADPTLNQPSTLNPQPSTNYQPSTLNPQPTISPQPIFPRFPGETPRAFSAFSAFFALGHGRSLQDVAAQLNEKLDTVKRWSSRFRWSDRVQSFNAGLLQQHAQTEATTRRKQAADWARRTSEYREQEWDAAQKLLGAAQCFLDSFGDHEVEKMTLAQVSRALQIASRIARQALHNENLSEAPVLAPLQAELAAALKKAYAQPPPAVAATYPQPSTLNPLK